MVRCLGVFLILALLLCGCAQNTTEPTPTDSIPDAGLSEPTGIYIPGSDVEIATNGAVRAFRLGNEEFYGCICLGQDLVLMHRNEGNGTLVLYHGENLEEVKSIPMGQGVAPNASQVHAGSQGICYFDSENRAMVFLNQNFVETGRMYLPENVQGSAWPAPDWSTVYYCTEQGIHAMDLQTGIARLLVEETAVHQEVTGVFGNGEVLRCEAEITEGQRETVLVDTATGGILRAGADFNSLQSYADQYFLPQMIKGVSFLHFGDGQTNQVLWPAEDGYRPVMLFHNNAIAMIKEEEQQTTLVYYDLQTGMRTGAITLDGVCKVWSLQGDGANGIWMLAQNGDQTHLYHWDTTKTPTEDANVYTQPMYTADAPNEEGLKQVQKDAAELGDQHGIDILIWQDAVKTTPENQFLTEEYRVQIYNHYLPRLQKALSAFPKDFFTKNADEKLQIALVGRIQGAVYKGTLPESGCVQFWNGKTPILMVTLDENFEFNLYHGLFLYMETRILSKSSAMYEWFRLNPSGFTYDNSYVKNMDRTDTTYVDGAKPYFVDLFSMSYAKEDRARLFAYACTAGNAETFKHTAIQTKLQRICKGIREAYGLKKVETKFLWEQYKS